MNEETESSEKIFGQVWAVRIGAAMLIGFAAVTGFAIYAKSNIASIEKAEAPTAVGDRNYFKLTEPVDAAKPLSRLHGKSLYFVEKKAFADAMMIKVGMDDDHAYPIYQLEDAEGPDAGFYYLKTEPNLFAKLKLQ